MSLQLLVDTFDNLSSQYSSSKGYKKVKKTAIINNCGLPAFDSDNCN